MQSSFIIQQQIPAYRYSSWYPHTDTAAGTHTQIQQLVPTYRYSSWYLHTDRAAGTCIQIQQLVPAYRYSSWYLHTDTAAGTYIQIEQLVPTYRYTQFKAANAHLYPSIQNNEFNAPESLFRSWAQLKFPGPVELKSIITLLTKARDWFILTKLKPADNLFNTLSVVSCHLRLGLTSASSSTKSMHEFSFSQKVTYTASPHPPPFDQPNNIGQVPRHVISSIVLSLPSGPVTSPGILFSQHDKPTCGTHYYLWHTLLPVAHTTTCGTHYCLWHTLLPVAHTATCGTHYCLWHTLLPVAHTTTFVANLGSCASKTGTR